MDTELQRETTSQDVELPEACVACGGAITARFTSQGATGVCLACHLVTVLGITHAKDGVHIGHLARARA